MKKGERLEKLILGSRYKNVMEFSKAAKVPYTTIKSMIQRDLKNASVDNVINICRVLGISVEYLTSESDQDELMVSPLSDYDFYPTAISAGLPYEVDGITQEDIQKLSIPDAIMGKHAGDQEIMLMRVSGDSMNKTMPDQSLIAVKPVTLGQLSNDDIVVYSHNHEYSVKYYYKDGNEIIFRPHSTDRVHRDTVFNLDDANELHIHGKVVMYIVDRD